MVECWQFHTDPPNKTHENGKRKKIRTEEGAVVEKTLIYL